MGIVLMKYNTIYPPLEPYF